MTTQQKRTKQNDINCRLVLVTLLAVALPTILVSFFGSRTNQTETSSSRHLRVTRLLQDTEETCTESCCQQYQQECPSGNPLNFLPLAIQIILIVVLLSMSALFSGLTLGLMSLDITGLEIVMSGEDRQNAEYAKKIYPVRQDGNLLLCTLLLGNVAVNTLLSILLADKAGGIVGFISSTFLIVIFGEIAPQAICSRHGLKIGSFTVPLVRVIMFIMYPVTKPLALSLDLALGAELATIYSSSEIRKMLEIHVNENALDKETANTMTGALLFKNIPVKQVMTPIANTFMLSVDEKLNFQTISNIFKTGYSRIPIYEVNRVSHSLLV
jgi:metal transporter CNNM